MKDQIPFEGYQSLIDSFLRTVKLSPDRQFLRIRHRGKFVSQTYREVFETVRRVGAYLNKKGFASGDRAAVVGENCPEWACSYLGVLWAGGVVVPLDSRATPVEWAHLIRHSESKFLFASPDVYEDIADFREKMPTLQEIISFSREDPEPNLHFITRTAKSSLAPEKRTRKDLAVILYTSGTTGVSKGVMLTHGNLIANTEQCLTVLDLNRDDRFFSVLPMHHSFECTCGFLIPFTIGASITFASSLKSRELLEDLRDTRPTAFLVVPLLIEKLHQGFTKNLKKTSTVRKGLYYGMKTLARACNPFTNGHASKKFLQPVRAKMGFEELRHIISGGAALPRWLSKEYEMLGFPILQGYGISETSPVLSVNLIRKCRNESVGLPLPGVDVKIVDPDPEGIGEIVVQGPNVMQGYYRNEEATQEVLKEGWFYTGDLGKIDGDGFLYVTGRKKSLIVTKAGKNICPEEVEEDLLKSPFVKEALVLAKIHPRTKNEEIHAIIYPNMEAIDEYAMEKKIAMDEKEIKELIAQSIERVNSILAEYKRIRHFSIREEEFPKTTTQKIKRYLFEEGGIEVK